MLSIILAAGNGTRMKSDKPKVLHEVNGKPMIQKVCEVTSNFSENLLVLGYKKEDILAKFPDVNYVTQEERLGTGHAVLMCKEEIKKHESVLITYGDGPLLSKETIFDMITKFEKEKLDGLLLTCLVDDPTGYGRILKVDGKVKRIVEQKDATAEEQKICEINVGIYLFKSSSLLQVLDKLDNKNAKGEYYLTDVIELLDKGGFLVDSILLKDRNEMLGVNSKKELAIASKILRERKLNELMDSGVIIIDPQSTYIEEDVTIGKDTIIYPNTIITGNTTIGENNVIYSSRIESCEIANNTKIDNSVLEFSKLEDYVTIGPYAHLRKGTVLMKKVHIGNFVEVKNSTLHEGVKSGHLTYLGDTTVGRETNIGAGTITCNYDGVKKHRTNIGENAFIGSNTILVSPVNIGNDVLTAAGSVLTKDVPDGKLAFGRAKQVVIEKKINKK